MPRIRHTRSRVTWIIESVDEIGVCRADFQELQKNSLACALMKNRRGAVVVANEKRRIVLANQAFVRLVGADELGDLIGKSACEMFGCPSTSNPSSCECAACGFTFVLDGAFSGAPTCAVFPFPGYEAESRRMVIRGELLRMLARRFVLAELEFAEETARI